MALTPVEIIALIVIVASAIKMLVLLVNPKSWMNFAKRIYARPGWVSLIALALAIVVLYYLTLEGITIVQILAVTAFVALIILVGIARDVPALLKKYDTMVKKGNLWKEYWLYALIWIVLLVWGAKELFM
jgi:hypothetical protein|tara:strand:- start:93 stop:482 length:390 start_codon:yes stop_codon:yes gene_type:complete